MCLYVSLVIFLVGHLCKYACTVHSKLSHGDELPSRNQNCVEGQTP